MYILISRATPVLKMMQKIARALNGYNSSVNKERNLIGPQRYWISSKIKADLENQEEEIKKLDYNWRNFEETTIDAIPLMPLSGEVEAMGRAMKERVEYMKYEEGTDIIVVEIQKNYQNCKHRKDNSKTWTFKPKD